MSDRALLLLMVIGIAATVVFCSVMAALSCAQGLC